MVFIHMLPKRRAGGEDFLALLTLRARSRHVLGLDVAQHTPSFGTGVAAVAALVQPGLHFHHFGFDDFV